MSTHKNLMTVCCAAVLAFGLAACGSSSDDNDMPPVTDSGMPEVEDAPAGPTTDQMTAAAATKVTAIGVEGKQTTDAGLGGIVPPPPEAEAVDPSYVMTIKRDRDGTTVEIEDPANAGDDDPKFIKQDVDLGVGRTMHVRTMPENEDGEVVEEVVIVKTDIKAPKATLFAKVPGGGRRC